jgi:hypothetical protein
MNSDFPITYWKLRNAAQNNLEVLSKFKNK